MILVLDSDDFLLVNTEGLKVRIFGFLAKNRVPEEEARAYYEKVRQPEFSLRTFIKTLLSRRRVANAKLDEDVEKLYVKIMSQCHTFVNKKFIAWLKKGDKRKRYLITNGEVKFNTDKLKYSRIWDLFDEDKIFIVPGTKKDKIAEICERHKDETVVFIDDNPVYFEDLDLEQHPNLWPIRYTGDPKALLEEITKAELPTERKSCTLVELHHKTGMH